MNIFGRIFKLAIYGESHGESLGIVVSGVPAGIDLSVDDFWEDIVKRSTGKFGTSKRNESDIPLITSGVFNNLTTGAPIHIFFENKEHNPSDYPAEKRFVPRPGHSDFTAFKKFGGFNDYRGSGHFSGRLTIALVAAGVIANKIIPCAINSSIESINGTKDYYDELKKAEQDGDSLGGIIKTEISNVPVGLGEPFFDSVESMLSHIIFAIPGIKAIEFGAGFAASQMKGSEYNDEIIDSNGKTATNNCGGICGGITNGNSIIFRTAIRPTSSIAKSQRSTHLISGETVEVSTTGRHDVCFALRVPPIISAAAACVIADLLMIRNANNLFNS